MSNQCQNCAAPLEGDYCHQCGQSTTDFDLPVSDFAKEFVSEAFSLDSRIRHTMKPLFFSPGLVPRAYVAGHRARFVPPVRLYIFASFAMFLVMTLGSGLTASDLSVNLSVSATDSTTSALGAGPVSSADSSERTAIERLQERIDQGLERRADDRRSFSGDFLNRQAQAMFALLPAFALLLKLAYRRRLYVHHLVFAVYFHSFSFLIVALVAVPAAVRLPALGAWLAIALLVIPIYLLLGMKRFYDESWVKTVVKFVVVSLAYVLLGTATSIAVLFVSLLAA